MVGAERDGRHVKGRGGNQALAKNYGFTDGEPDFIVNYDSKYRMGRGADN